MATATAATATVLDDLLQDEQVTGLIPLKTHTWIIRGVSPLMQSNPQSMVYTEADNTGGLTGKKKEYDDQEEMAIRCYCVDKERTLLEPAIDKTGKRRLPKNPTFVHPTAAFRKAMITAMSGLKFGKINARYLVGQGCYPPEDYTTILDDKGKPHRKPELDKRTVVIGKNRVFRVRPKFINWTMKLIIDLDERINTDQATIALNAAGRNVGIGEYRPDPSDGKKGVGTYGRFVAELMRS